ncbi:HAD family hydrolase [Verrucomicrobiaceae bacterium 227]
MKLVIFDIDGTLTQTNQVDSGCFIAAIKEVLGVAEFETDWTRYQYVTDSGIAQEISHRYRDRPISGTEIKALQASTLDQLKQQPDSAFAEIPGARSFLEHLENSPEYAVAFATGANEASARYKLATAGFTIDGIPLASSSDAVVREHIMLRAMDRAAQRHGVPFTEITYFGDAIWDINASANLGWRFIGIGPGITEGLRFDDYCNPGAILQAL